MISLLMIISLLLGITAWALPIINIILSKKYTDKNFNLLSILSVTLCTISLYLQILYYNHLIKLWDSTSLMDTSGAVVVASTVLLAGTIILNIISMFLQDYRGIL